MNLQISKFEDWLPLCREILHKKLPSIIALEGDIGAGKTSFVKIFVSEISDQILATSPTFPLMNVYETKHYLIRHFDLYRLNSNEEILELGFQDLVIDADFVFIEWPDKAWNLIPKPFAHIKIVYDIKNKCRHVTICIET